jgi:hypothetical protein
MKSRHYYWALYICIIWTIATWLTLSYGEDPAFSPAFFASALGTCFGSFLTSAVLWVILKLIARDFAKAHMPQIFIVFALLTAFLVFYERNHQRNNKNKKSNPALIHSNASSYNLQTTNIAFSQKPSAVNIPTKHERFQWKPNGCHISVEFPGNPTEKVVSTNEGPLQVATLISDFSLMKASFQNAQLPDLSNEDRIQSLKICAEELVEQLGLQKSQYEQSEVNLGQRVRVKGIKAVRHSDRVDNERVIIDIYIIDNGLLTLTVTHGEKELDYTAGLFLKNVADMTSNWQY